MRFLRCLAVILGIVACLCVGGDAVMAKTTTSSGGAGNGGAGTVNKNYNCNNSSTYTMNVCSDKKKGTDLRTGGASWHIFKTRKNHYKNGIFKGSGGLQYCKKKADQDKKDCTTINALKGGYKNNLATVCKSEKYKYYIAYAFDGWHGNSNKDLNGKPDKHNVFTYWGPLAWDTPLSGWSGGAPKYNSDGAKKYNDVVNAIEAGTNANGWKLTKEAALQFYRQYLVDSKKKANIAAANKVSKIDAGIGFFCSMNKTEVDFKVFLVDESWNYIGGTTAKKPWYKGSVSAGLNPTSKSKKVNKTIPIDENSYYKFTGWYFKGKKPVKCTKTTCESIECKNDKGFCKVSKIQDDISVYAVYKVVTSGCTGCCPGDPYYENGCIPPDDECRKWGSVVQGETSTVSKVRNLSVEKFSDWKDKVFAKPTDEVNWTHCYYPGVQYKVDTLATPRGVHQGGTSGHNGYENPTTCSQWNSSCRSLESYSFINYKLSSGLFGSWQNLYAISSSPSIFRSKYNGTRESFDIGDTAVKQFEEAENNTVEVRYTGSTLAEKITTGTPSKAGVTDFGPHQWNCEWDYIEDRMYDSWDVCDEYKNGKCMSSHTEYEYRPAYDWTSTCEHTESYIRDDSKWTTTSSQADVVVPYNFTNQIEMLSDSDGGIAYAGEKLPSTIDFRLITDVKENGELEEEYATKAPSSYRLVAYREGNEDDILYTTSSERITLNLQGDLEGDEQDINYSSMAIPDVSAGTTICVKAEVYPIDSGTDDNTSESGFTNAWRRTENEVCYLIAKKPSLQVWGGNVYTSGLIDTSVAKKWLIAGFNDTSDSGLHRDFGSFGELGVVANYTVRGFASGAALGYVGSGIGPNSDGSKMYNMSGCRLAPLTIPNSNCSSFTSGGSSNYSNPNTNALEKEKKKIYDQLISPSLDNCQAAETTDIGGLGTLCYKSDGDLTISLESYLDSETGEVTQGTGSGSVTSSNITWGAGDGDLWVQYHSNPNAARSIDAVSVSIDGTALAKNACWSDDWGEFVVRESCLSGLGEGIHSMVAEIEMNDRSSTRSYTINIVRDGSLNSENDSETVIFDSEVSAESMIKRVYAKGDIAIASNLRYVETGFNRLSQVPKIVIYAEGDINIYCKVSRIDAILVAGGTVDTCIDGDDSNDKKRSNQLTIYGAVIANKLEAGRTYGAATGTNSIVPAEIINFDPSLYLWNRVSGPEEGAISGGLETSYMVELSPRQ